MSLNNYGVIKSKLIHLEKALVDFQMPFHHLFLAFSIASLEEVL